MKNHKPAIIAKVNWAFPPSYHIEEVHQDVEVCEDCGMILTLAVAKMSCPPWESSGRGDMPQPSSHVGAGEVKELQVIYEILDKVLLKGWESEGFHRWEEHHVIDCKTRIARLIERLEGRDKK